MTTVEWASLGTGFEAGIEQGRPQWPKREDFSSQLPSLSASSREEPGGQSLPRTLNPSEKGCDGQRPRKKQRGLLEITWFAQAAATAWSLS